jgi:hypothetical protein
MMVGIWLFGPGEDEPPRIGTWAVSIADVLDGNAGEQGPEQLTALRHCPGRPSSRRVDEGLRGDRGGARGSFERFQSFAECALLRRGR